MGGTSLGAHNPADHHHRERARAEIVEGTTLASESPGLEGDGMVAGMEGVAVVVAGSVGLIALVLLYWGPSQPSPCLLGPWTVKRESGSC